MKDPFAPLSTLAIHDARITRRFAKTTVESFDEEAGLPLHSMRLTSHISRLRLLYFFMIAVAMVMAFRLVYLQMLQGASYRASAEENRLSLQKIPAPRGLIVDRNGATLVRNIPQFSLEIIPATLPTDTNERNVLLDAIARELGQTRKDIDEKLKNADAYFYDPIEISTLDYNTALKLRILFAGNTGVNIVTSTQREYPEGELLAHVLGYTGKMTEEEYQKMSATYELNDRIGKTGLEATYENAMRGTKGLRRVEVDALENAQKTVAESEPVSGDTIHLGLDLSLQRTLYDALKESVEKNGGTGGAAVAIDPQSGLVRALVSYPSYEINDFSKGIAAESYNALLNDASQPLFNRATSGMYPPGSTFKPLMAAAALQEGLITENTTVLSTGGISIGQWTFPDWKAGGHGRIDVKKAIADSVNTFFYAVSGGYQEQKGLGIDRMKSYAESFGLNHPLGIDLPQESAGFIPTKQWKEETIGEPWTIGNTYQTGIGQGYLQLTPLQIASYTVAIANGGTLYRPRLLESQEKATGENIAQESVVLNSGMVSVENLRIVQEGMRQGVLSGSGASMQTLPVTSAGKTGTAQFGNDGKTHAVFTSFAPFENPELVITVLVEGGGQGHTAALPVAKKGYEIWFAK